MSVTILSVEEIKGKKVRWLLDGRQRRNAFLQMYEDPENIYNWAKRFVGFKNNNQPSELGEMFWKKIDEYIEYSEEDETEKLMKITLRTVRRLLNRNIKMKNASTKNLDWIFCWR